MRKNARWSGTNVNGLHMGGLGMSMGLRKGKSHIKDRELKNEKTYAHISFFFFYLQDVKDLDALVLLNPFLEVIRSGNTTGPIAGTALGSVEKFLHYGIIGLHNPSIAFAMNALSSAATHCKFEASDAASDELVLLRMLQVLQVTLTSECGQVLSDEAVCEMMETGLSMCCQMRLTDMLRRSAEHVMIKMVISIFERLKNLDDEWQFVDTPTESDGEMQRDGQTTATHAPHMSTPRPSPSPTPSTDTTPNNNDINHSSNDDLREPEQQQQQQQQQDDDNSVSQNLDIPPVTDVNTMVSTSSSSPVPPPPVAPSPTYEEDSDRIEDRQQNQDVQPLRPYGLPAIRELLRVLVSLLNPHEHKHTDSMRMMALSILNVAFEVGGRSISRFETLRGLVTDEFCKFLFQLAKTDSTPLLSLTLRTISTVFDTFRPYIKLQQELFLFFLIERLSPSTGMGSRGISVDVDEEGNISFMSSSAHHASLDGNSGEKASPSAMVTSGGSQLDIRSGSPNMFLNKSTDYYSAKSHRASHTLSDPPMIPGEVRELLLECLLQCARIPTFMVDLWFNYDCDLSCGDLFEELIQFLSKNSFPDPHNYSVMNYHILCLDTLLLFIDHMVERVGEEELTSTDELLERKARKRIILTGSMLFNDNPKKGIAYLKENGIIQADASNDTKESLAHFLRSTQQLNKKSLGEYLGKPDNLDLLQVFMRQFDFEGKRMDEALRMVLETFRLPGESQQIMRVTDTFSEVYFATKPAQIANNDAAQLLAYSIIMLNTDQHNPQVRRRMTLEDYMRNLRGVNGGEDFPKDYLGEIYEAIRQDEIVMPEEHEGRLGFNYAWKQLLHRSDTSGPFVVCDTSSYDKAMFEMSWKPAIAAISYAFNTAQDDDTLQKAISGFHQCAMLSAHFGLYDVFDSIVVNLATMTGLLDTSGHSSSLPDPIVDVAGEKYVISSLAVRFGRNYKAQLAAVVAFTIVTRHGNSLRKGWTKILQVIRNLFVNSLLPHSMLQVEDFVSGTTSIPLKPKNITQSRQQQRRDGSLLSTLSSYLLSPYSNDETYRADPTEEEVESTMCAVDCVAACRLEDLFNDISNLKLEPLQALLTAIGKVGYDGEAVKNAEKPIPYDPATVLFLEFMITITIRNDSRIELLW
ncbi:uncharacterized protein BX664DRAFT_366573 [Halteromyces radiatus]|uniref:uncharacterized protein n=1 Tax=Halteromyces radiatus TaxID=101107 RepID=UPI002220F406|nr:uncharacterized protein BX664DRAFT_366573 [Halteromyces radiatus]KAI8082800.1 hypothetical protein BX664DRAFT_366573 [Halteromyces radiatus]